MEEFQSTNICSKIIPITSFKFPGYNDELCPYLSVVAMDLLQNEITSSSENDIINKYLSGPEKDQLHKYTFRKRRYEWFAGRIAAKHAVMALLLYKGLIQNEDLQCNDIEVIANPDGKPVVHITPQPEQSWPVEVSLSHSGNLAVGYAVLGGSCGLDIQMIEERVLRVREKYIHPEENLLLSDLSGYSQMSLLTMVWAVKEAVRKKAATLPLPELLKIRIQDIEALTDREFRVPVIFMHREKKRSATAITFYHEEYAGAIVV